MSSKRSNCFCAVMLALALSGHSQTNPALNAGFETWSGGTPVNWLCTGKTYITQEGNERFSGNSSACIRVPTTGTTVELYQDIAVTGGATYTFTCRVLDNTPEGEIGLLLNWRNGASSLTTKSSGHSSDQAGWQQIGLDGQQAPQSATTARIKIHGYQQAGAGGGFVYADAVTVGGDVSLSVHLSGFEAVQLAEGVEIRWTTESEIRTSGFWISRAIDADGPFERITTVPIAGHGTSSSREAYAFVDRNNPAGDDSWYRLEELEENGDVTCLGMVQIRAREKRTMPASESLVRNYPNPFNPGTTLFYTVPREQGGKRIQLKILDLLGRTILTPVDGPAGCGTFSVAWDGRDANGRDVPSGAYFCRLECEDGLVNFWRMMKIK